MEKLRENNDAKEAAIRGKLEERGWQQPLSGKSEKLPPKTIGKAIFLPIRDAIQPKEIS